ncbi:methylmalonyl Co-A mutase-associated GTPase MeaB [Mucilaginibacter sp. HMF5004]|uniref:methylmalonyl Co-A mutase-associated GTPase MeaB n=1 Tax=Mucilaginibacter rivuli TaxID=2857527 RepID=UPI001C5DE787|nr:methylmalonyl Co-A mutase-associated GTPase MeaB [Mucilaginibacter rivuli]MBW4888617.1 methylmalonyl Co-A mutase-associated GTPase MeaB [Mucilaginibacter rivuli]
MTTGTPIDFKKIARQLTLVENDLPGSADILKALRFENDVPVIGITGPPGAGKSTLVNAIITGLLKQQKKIAVLAVDPTSPFNLGSLLGDRIRMATHFNNPNIFIRSIATRGAVGGLSIKTIEMADVLRAGGFDYVFVETVGVGQSEIDIAGLADVTIVVLVPEAGDEIQHIKSGLMEIADVFIVNKCDRDGADTFAGNVKKMVSQKHGAIPVFKTNALNNIGIDEVANYLVAANSKINNKKVYLLTEKVYRLIQHHKMASVNKTKLQQLIAGALLDTNFNIYQFAETFNGHS